VQAEFRLRPCDQFTTDALLLEVAVDRDVREVTTVHPVHHRAGNADECIFRPRGDGQIGIGDHGGNAIGIVNGPALRQSRAAKDVSELLCRDGFVDFVSHHFLNRTAS